LFQQNLGMPIKAVAPAAVGCAVKPVYGETCVLHDGGFDSYTVLFWTAGPQLYCPFLDSRAIAGKRAISEWLALLWHIPSPFVDTRQRIGRASIEKLAPVGVEKLFEQ
jgi:hypothetical protein